MKADSIADIPSGRSPPDLIQILSALNLLNYLLLKQCDPQRFQIADHRKNRNQHGKKLADLVVRAKQLLNFLFPKFTTCSAQLFEYLALQLQNIGNKF